MKGPKELLVSIPSATHCIPEVDKRGHMCAIDREHSEIVKYAQHDSVYDPVKQQLQEIVARAVAEPVGPLVKQTT